MYLERNVALRIFYENEIACCAILEWFTWRIGFAEFDRKNAAYF